MKLSNLVSSILLAGTVLASPVAVVTEATNEEHGKVLAVDSFNSTRFSSHLSIVKKIIDDAGQTQLYAKFVSTLKSQDGETGNVEDKEADSIDALETSLNSQEFYYDLGEFISSTAEYEKEKEQEAKKHKKHRKHKHGHMHTHGNKVKMMSYEDMKDMMFSSKNENSKGCQSMKPYHRGQNGINKYMKNNKIYIDGKNDYSLKTIVKDYTDEITSKRYYIIGSQINTEKCDLIDEDNITLVLKLDFDDIKSWKLKEIRNSRKLLMSEIFVIGLLLVSLFSVITFFLSPMVTSKNKSPLAKKGVLLNENSYERIPTS
ncbi:unnamed protein product [[Candida] boidinii]|nr:unnamed protein product [[Candida] boidinii]